jgi:hypothetical protein
LRNLAKNLMETHLMKIQAFLPPSLVRQNTEFVRKFQALLRLDHLLLNHLKLWSRSFEVLRTWKYLSHLVFLCYQPIWNLWNFKEAWDSPCQQLNLSWSLWLDIYLYYWHQNVSWYQYFKILLNFDGTSFIMA